MTGQTDGGTFQTSAAAGNSLFAGFSVITEELWIKPNASASGIHYLEYGISDFSLESTSLNPLFNVNNVFLGSVPLTQGAYSQVVLELYGTHANIYRNGAIVSSQPFSSSINAGSGALFLASRTASSRFVNADIDEVSVYHSALSPAQVAAHYSSASVPEPATTTVAAATVLAAWMGIRRFRKAPAVPR